MIEVPTIHIVPADANQPEIAMCSLTPDELCGLSWDETAFRYLRAETQTLFADPRALYERWEAKGAQAWGVRVGNDDSLAGHVLLRDGNGAKPGYPEIGRLLRSSGLIGRGIGSLCASATLHYALATGLYGITSETLLANVPARKSLQGIGAIEVRRGTQPIPYGTEGQSSVYTRWMVGNPDAADMHKLIFPDLTDGDLEDSARRLGQAMQRIKRIDIS